MRIPIRSIALFGAFAAFSFAASCGGDNPSTPGSIAISLSPTSGSVMQGGTVAVSANVTLTNFTGEVSVSASGLPSGVTVTRVNTVVSGGIASAALSITASATAPVGTSNITITASGSGVDSKSATYALTVTTAPVASYSMTLTPTAASVAQGSNVTTTVSLARSNFTGAVALAATGLPTGATATYSQPGTANSGTVSINTGTAAAGTYNVTITGSATGLADVTAAFTLTVTAAPVATTLTYVFCGTAPVWLGYQSGTAGAWTTVSPGANNTYTFNVTGPSGVAFVSAVNGNAATSGYSTSVYYGSPSDLQSNGTASCSSGTKTVNGTVAGMATGDQAEVDLGRIYTYAFANGPWTLSNVPSGSYDLMASLIGTNDIASKVIIRRAQNPADNATLPVLDFGAAEAIATTPITLTFAGLAATQPSVFTELESVTGTTVTLSSTTASSGTAMAAGVPAAGLVPTDLHSTFAFVNEGGAARGAVAYYAAPANKTIAIGPIVSTPTASTVSITPYARPQLTVASQAAYSGIALAAFSQGGSLPSASDRSVDIMVSPSYFGSVPATWTFTVPDFSAASGYSSSFALASGVVTTYEFYAYGFNLMSGVPADGTNFQFGAYQGTMVPSSAGAFAPRATLNSAPTAQTLTMRLRTQRRALPGLRQR